MVADEWCHVATASGAALASAEAALKEGEATLKAAKKGGGGGAAAPLLYLIPSSQFY